LGKRIAPIDLLGRGGADGEDGGEKRESGEARFSHESVSWSGMRRL
jgi:hypothetical protein